MPINREGDVLENPYHYLETLLQDEVKDTRDWSKDSNVGSRSPLSSKGKFYSKLPQHRRCYLGSVVGVLDQTVDCMFSISVLFAK